jgi:pSer/pThr/pTyr-binding forkhead associated (FHA) protein
MNVLINFPPLSLKASLKLIEGAGLENAPDERKSYQHKASRKLPAAFPHDTINRNTLRKWHLSDPTASSSLDSPTQPGAKPSKATAMAGRLVILRGPQAGQEFQLSPGINVFGREEGFILRDVRVSRRHAHIQVIANEFMLFDLQSTNGTFVNGQRITQPVLVQHGDTIRMGDTILVLKLQGQGLKDPSVIGARTADLTGENTGGTTILASRSALTTPTRTDIPNYHPLKKTDIIDDSEDKQDNPPSSSNQA